MLWLGSLFKVTDLCGLKPQFDDEGAGDGKFFFRFSMMGSDTCNCILWELLLGSRYMSCFSVEHYGKTTSEICFCKWGRGQDVMNRVSNNLVDRIYLWALWPAEMLHIKPSCLTQCFTFSMIFLYFRMDWGKIFSLSIWERGLLNKTGLL